MTLRDRVAAELPRALDDLRALVAIPSISSLPEHDGDVLRSAEAVRALYEAEGVEARVVTSGGARPTVIGHKAGPAGAPTVLLYGHHDVQPTGELSLWSCEPWELTERDGRLYGRGVCDDKGAVALHLALLRAFGDDLPVTVTLLVEGEEEIGSPRFGQLLTEHAEELRADYVVVPDAVNPDAATPSVTTSLRGNADFVITLSTLTRAVHSGLYGGAVPCALTSLIQLLATLHDDEGNVAVAGLTSEPDFEAQVLLPLDGVLLDGVTETGTGSLAERTVANPTISVLAVDAVPVARASNVLHPSASAKVGVRVPPSGDPELVLDAVERHLRDRVRNGAHVRIERGRGGRGFRSGTPIAQWREAALEAFGVENVEVGVGGSIPFVNALSALLPKAEFLITSVQDSMSQAHSHDESMDIVGFEKACVAHALLLEKLGTGY